MPSKDPLQDMPNPAEPLWEMAAKATDPAERESLLRSAQKVDESHRRVVRVFAQAQESIDRSREFIESLKKEDHLPTWVVILVFCSFFAFLAHVAVKHHL
jgi:hypothetical protein